MMAASIKKTQAISRSLRTCAILVLSPSVELGAAFQDRSAIIDISTKMMLARTPDSVLWAVAASVTSHPIRQV
ncbi:hypothetical protein DV701_11030 [Ornithinimicrobium avium]|uniref:Uncharacterized protein n=1 Tax=Ornithinimicrobium avium TaxID=2283195 RepID=A0A345NNH8_9MICO|nr:hypothetical protein DV701_11030 [Ornithinimicrobium avium]